MFGQIHCIIQSFTSKWVDFGGMFYNICNCPDYIKPNVSQMPSYSSCTWPHRKFCKNDLSFNLNI